MTSMVGWKLVVRYFRSFESVANVLGELFGVLLVTREEALNRWWERRFAQIKPDV